jgi:uncharacterized protein (DUF58 family)
VEGYIAQNEVLNSRQFYLGVKRLADSLTYGTDRSAFVGQGLEYVQSRMYQPGDPIRAIDWRVTARTRRVHVKEYEAPRRMPVYLLVDTSASMTLRSVKQSKYEQAVFIAGGVALACLDRVSPVGILGVGGINLHVRPSLSKDQILGWLHRLRHFDYQQPTQLAARVAELTPSLSHRTLVIVLSDLHDPAALPILKRLGQRHDCVVLQFRDPAESSLRGAGLMRAREVETGRPALTHGRARFVDQDAVETQLKRALIDHLVIQTDQPYVSRLRQFLRTRGLLGRGAR